MNAGPRPFPAELRRVYWETTAGCNLRGIHCRRQDVLAKGNPEEPFCSYQPQEVL